MTKELIRLASAFERQAQVASSGAGNLQLSMQATLDSLLQNGTYPILKSMVSKITINKFSYDLITRAANFKINVVAVTGAAALQPNDPQYANQMNAMFLELTKRCLANNVGRVVFDT